MPDTRRPSVGKWEWKWKCAKHGEHNHRLFLTDNEERSICFYCLCEIVEAAGGKMTKIKD